MTKNEKILIQTKINQHKKILSTEAIYFAILAFCISATPTFPLFWISALIGLCMTLFGFFYLFRPLGQDTDTRSGVMDFLFSVEHILIGINFFLFLQVSFSVFITFVSILFLVRGLYFLTFSTSLIKDNPTSAFIGSIISFSSIFLAFFFAYNPEFTVNFGTLTITIALFAWASLDVIILNRLKTSESPPKIKLKK